MPKTISKFRDERGSILLISILILSVVTITAAGTAALALGALRDAQATDAAMFAYYGAESGVENALYNIRCDSSTQGCNSDAALSTFSVQSPQSLTNGVKWQRDVGPVKQVVFSRIPLDKTVELDLYDTDANTTYTNLRQFTAEFTNAAYVANPSTNVPPVMNVELVGWNPTNLGTISWDQSATETVTSLYPISQSGTYINLPHPWPYKLRIRAAKAAMENVRVRAYDGATPPNIVPIPGILRIDSRGDYGGTRQLVSVVLPRHPPLSGIFDFVLFSECDIIKGAGSPTCPP